MITGMAKTAGNLVGDAVGKIGGEKVESVVTNVVDIPLGMVERLSTIIKRRKSWQK
jgi:hypothetical protein